MRKKFERLVIIVYVLLLLVQIKTTNITTAYTHTPAEAARQIQRMNYYSFNFARLGYILETKKEIQILRKAENNFFIALDFAEYFPKFIPYLLSPFFFLGLYLFIKNRGEHKLYFNGFLFSIFVMTVIGPHDKYGPILLLPFLYYFVVLGLLKIFKRK